MCREDEPRNDIKPRRWQLDAERRDTDVSFRIKPRSASGRRITIRYV